MQIAEWMDVSVYDRLPCRGADVDADVDSVRVALRDQAGTHPEKQMKDGAGFRHGEFEEVGNVALWNYQGMARGNRECVRAGDGQLVLLNDPARF